MPSDKPSLKPYLKLLKPFSASIALTISVISKNSSFCLLDIVFIIFVCLPFNLCKSLRYSSVVGTVEVPEFSRYISSIVDFINFSTHILLHIIAHKLLPVNTFAHTLCYYFFMKDFAKKLKDSRESKGLSQSEVSKALGMTRNAFTNYEAGIREPSLDTLKLICQVLDVSADYLLGLTDSEVEK